MKLEIDIPYYMFEQIKRENTIKSFLHRIDFAVRNGVERPHGEWKEKTALDGQAYMGHECSVCGFGVDRYMHNAFSFCPNCGANMKEEGEAE